MELQKITRLSLLLALAVVLGIVESFIPFFNGFTIPGLKLGLANIIIVFVLYAYDWKSACYVSILRVVLVGMLRTGLFSITFLFSLIGAICSLIVMGLFKKTNILSMLGVSIIGSLFHSIGQIIGAIVLLKTFNLIYYLPWLLLFSIPTGIFIGLLSQKLLKFYKTNL